jgi:hypothetical protein
VNRLLVIIIGIVGLGAIALAVVLIAGGGQQQTSIAGLNPTPGSEVASAAAEAPAENQNAEAVAAAVARFGAWANPLRAAGFRIDVDQASSDGEALILSDLFIAGPPDALAWRWTAPSVRVDSLEDNAVKITPSSTMELTLTMNGDPVAMPITAETMEINVQRDDESNVGTLTLSFTNLAIGDAEVSEPISAAEGELQFTFAAGGDATIPSGSTATLQLSHLVLPGQAGGPLGTTINTLNADLVFDQPLSSLALNDALAPWIANDGGLTVNNIELQWGALRFTGSGVLSLDEMGRPTGTLDVEITNILLALDAFNAALRFDRDVLADTYAALLLELGDDPEAETLPFTIAIADGQFVLSGESHGFADIVLGTVSPLFTPVTVE